MLFNNQTGVKQPAKTKRQAGQRGVKLKNPLLSTPICVLTERLSHTPKHKSFNMRQPE